MHLAKLIINQRCIYKIHSSRFRINKWSLNLSFDEAKKNEEIVPLGDSTILRMIRKIRSMDITEDYINSLKTEIRRVKKKNVNTNNKQEIKELYKKLDSAMIIEDYVAIIFDTMKDWNRANSKKNPIFFNGYQYVRLVGTNGGIKNNVIIFCKKEIYDNLDTKLNNGRDKTKKYIPAKFESYKALHVLLQHP
jgi:hypothetical protein